MLGSGGGTNQRRVPGEIGIWVFVFADMSAFTFFFTLFAVYRRQNTAVSSIGAAQLHPTSALVNTVLLVLASFLVVLAMTKLRDRGGHRTSAALFGLAAVLGVGFVINKIAEYGDVIGAGYTMTSNEFFTYYFAITGIHLLHVIVGIVVLTVMAIDVLRSGWQARQFTSMENGCIYWHMVDLLWLVIVPVIYFLH
jgi:nitric oxide reductase NorE protein